MSTEDQITYISQAIEDAFQDKKHTLAVLINLEKAFYKVWKESESEFTPVLCCWANVRMDRTVHAHQESKSTGKTILEQKEDP